MGVLKTVLLVVFGLVALLPVYLLPLTEIVMNTFVATPFDPEVPDVKIQPVSALGFAGQRVLVVGGTKGIGRGVAENLAAAGALVEIVGRSRGPEVVKALVEASPDKDESKFRFHKADLASKAGVKTFVDSLPSDAKYNALVMTVGTWPNFDRPLTEDMYDRVVFLDLWARALTFRGMDARGLLAPDASVMSVLSTGMKLDGDPAVIKPIIQKQKADYSHDLSGLTYLFGVLDAWLQEASKQHPGYAFVSTNPGIVRTDLLFPTFGKTLSKVLMKAGEIAGLGSSIAESGLYHANMLASRHAGRVSRFDPWFRSHLPTALAEKPGFGEWLYNELVLD